jgi:enoyl-CoA hydratase
MRRLLICAGPEGRRNLLLCEPATVIDTQQRGEIGIFRMHHGKANALDLEFCEEIVKRLDEANQSAIRALVITGHGAMFSAGVDLFRVLHGGPAYVRSFLPALKKAFEALLYLQKPVVAAINGHAIAGGCVLACAADLRLMALDSGRIGIPELRVGVPFPAVALEMVRMIVAPADFRALVYEGATLSPKEANEIGLVDATVAPEELLDRAVALAESLAAIPPEVFAMTKRQMRHPLMKRIREGAAEFDAAIDNLWTTPATLAAIRAYVARTLNRS